VDMQDKRTAKKDSMPEVDVQDKRTVDEDNRRRERAFFWYARMDLPTRTEFKRKVEESSMDTTPEDIDLLPWNLTGKQVNISKMNAITRASILKK
jgi:hypothetical protein